MALLCMSTLWSKAQIRRYGGAFHYADNTGAHTYVTDTISVPMSIQNGMSILWNGIPIPLR